VESCPTAETICNMTSLPCTNSGQYVCPYYSYSQFAKNDNDELGVLATKGPASTDWWPYLANYTGSSCVDDAMMASIPQEIQAAMNTASSCGSYYQTTSMYPGEGPCSALFFETTEFMHRCYPIIPKSVQGNIAAVGASGLSTVPQEQITKVRRMVTPSRLTVLWTEHCRVASFIAALVNATATQRTSRSEVASPSAAPCKRVICLAPISGVVRLT
jgi:hypothetical protein